MAEDAAQCDPSVSAMGTTGPDGRAEQIYLTLLGEAKSFKESSGMLTLFDQHGRESLVFQSTGAPPLPTDASPSHFEISRSFRGRLEGYRTREDNAADPSMTPPDCRTTLVTWRGPRPSSSPARSLPVRPAHHAPSRRYPEPVKES
jgi:hypothetical protein